MAKYSMAFLDALRTAGIDGDIDFLREAVQVMAELMMELEVGEKIGAERFMSAPRKAPITAMGAG